MFSKKKPGYYWRLRKKIIEKVHQGDTVYLGDYPEKARAHHTDGVQGPAPNHHRHKQIKITPKGSGL